MMRRPLNCIEDLEGVERVSGQVTGSCALAERIRKVAADLVRSCGSRTRRDVLDEEVGEMTRLLADTQPGNAAGRVEG